MRFIVKDTLAAVSYDLHCPNEGVQPHTCFKIFGYDILCDRHFKLYLGEINTRQIQFQCPPMDFKTKFYYDVLDLVILQQHPAGNHFILLNNSSLSEGFSVSSPSGGGGCPYTYMLPILIMLVIFLVVCLALLWSKSF